MSTSSPVTVTNWRQDATSRNEDVIAGETPIALTYNKVSHVVMMATAADLEDFALGFSLTEGIMLSPAELLDVKVMPRELGIEVALTTTIAGLIVAIPALLIAAHLTARVRKLLLVTDDVLSPAVETIARRIGDKSDAA